MPTTQRRGALATGAVAMSVILAACGSGDDTAVPPGTDPATTSVPVDVTTTEPTTSTPSDTDVPGTTGATAPDTTSGSAPETTGQQPGTTPPTPQVDEAAVALIAANLYNVPGAQVCDGIAYMFPAEGGDLFMVCIGRVSAADLPGRLELRVPDGTVVGRVEVRLHDDATDHQLPNDLVGRSLVVTHPDGAQRVLGLVIRRDDEPFGLAVPAFLPHARPSGTWTAEFTSESTSPTELLEVLAPCASGVAPGLSDPFRFDPAVRFTRVGPVPFSHCLAFPDVIDVPLVEAKDTLQQFAADRGLDLEVIDGAPDCADAVVRDTSVEAGAVERRSAGGAEGSVFLTVECP